MDTVHGVVLNDSGAPIHQSLEAPIVSESLRRQDVNTDLERLIEERRCMATWAVESAEHCDEKAFLLRKSQANLDMRDFKKRWEENQAILAKLAQEKSEWDRLENTIDDCKRKFDSDLKNLQDSMSAIFKQRDLSDATKSLNDEQYSKIAGPSDMLIRISPPCRGTISELEGQIKSFISPLYQECKRITFSEQQSITTRVYGPTQARADAMSILKLATSELSDQQHLMSHACPICFGTDVEEVFDPCGHTSCRSCSEKLSSTCPVCRSNVTRKIKIYFSS